MNKLLIISVCAALWPRAVGAKSYRDPEVRRAFMKIHPCPATGKTKGRCDGWQVDHIIPLCFYGVDATWNMGWKTVRDHREKTKLDVKVCTWDGK